jgi:hypothetical protein
MAQPSYKTHIQREKPSPASREKREEPVTDVKMSLEPPSPGMRWAFRVWLAGFLFLAAWLVWDLVVALLFR